MLIGIMSDSHDNAQTLRQAVNIFNAKKVTAVYHAGDITSPRIINIITDIQSTFDAVFGNSDTQKTEFEKINGGRFNFHHFSYEWVLEGKSFFMTHKPENITSFSDNRHFDCVIYGHTHLAKIEYINETLFINPGEVLGHRSDKATIALLELPSLQVKIITLQ